MSDPVSFVRLLDNAARASGNGTAQSDDYNQIQFFPEREDALSLVPVIFQHAQTPLVLIAGARALDYAVTNRWDAMSADQKVAFRASVLGLFATMTPGHCCFMIVQKVLVLIAIREFPENWSDFLDFVFSGGPKFVILADFLHDVKNEQGMTAEHAVRLREAIVRALPVILGGIIPRFGEDGSMNSLLELLPYRSGEMLARILSAPIFTPSNSDAFRCLCEIALLPNASKEIVMRVLAMIVRLMTDDDMGDDVQISAVVMQNLDVLETQGMVEILFRFHQRLLVAELQDTAEYWEYFLLSLYSSAKNGNVERVRLHSAIIPALLSNLMGAFAKPPEFVLKQGGGNNFESVGVPYEQERTMLLCMVSVYPELVVQGISAAFEELSRNFDAKRFAMVCSCAGAIASAANVDNTFAMRCMQFVYTVYQSLRLDASVVACFLYLATIYMKCHKITNEMAAAAATLARDGFDTEAIHHMCIQYLLTASRELPESVAEILAPTSMLSLPATKMSADGFVDIAEAAGRCCLPRNEGESVVGVIAGRWESLRASASSFDSTRELQAVMCELIGISRVDPVCVAQIMRELLPQLEETTKNFHGIMLELAQSIGPKARSRDDVRLMLGFIRHEMQLFREMKYDACDWLITSHGLLPLEMRTPEILLLCERIIGECLTPPLMQLIREAVIRPTEIFVSERENVTMIPENATYLARMLFRLAQCHPECLIDEDITTLVCLEKLANPHIHGMCIRALLMTCHQESHFSEALKGPFITNLLPHIISATVTLTSEQSHRSSFTDLLDLAHFTITMILSPAIASIRLFPDVDNVTGMVRILMEDMVYSPLLVIDDVRQAFVALFSGTEREQFENNIVALASMAKQTTITETIQHLTNQKIKAVLDAEINTAKTP